MKDNTLLSNIYLSKVYKGDLMKEQLLDREIETKDVMQIINVSTDNNKILLLTGISGVGKSGLIEKLTQNPSLDQTILSVKVSKSSVDTIENQQYFNALYKTVTKYAKNKVFDRVPSPNQQSVKTPKYLFKFIGSVLKSKLGVSDIAPLSEPEESESVIRKKDYLIYILKNTNIIIDIENIQNIDTQSLEILKEIINESSKKTFIFEYTLVHNRREHFENLYKEFREICSDIWCYKVEKMDFTIAKNLEPQNICIDDEELCNLYEKSGGNLMEIILANEKSSKNISNINIKIAHLSKKEKYLLYIIYLNEDTILYDELARMTIENENDILLDFEKLNLLIAGLCKKNILVMEKNIIRIKHDSISDTLHHFVQNPILYCAYSTIKKYYNCFEHDDKAIEKLLSLYLKFSDQDLLVLLPDVKKLILNIKYPSLIIKKLDYFRERMLDISSQGFCGTYHLTLLIVEICLNKKMGDEAKKNLDLIYDETNTYHVALQAQIYSLQENMEAHEALCKIIQKIQEGTRLRLICEICLLYLKTKLFTSEKAKSYGEKLIKTVSYQGYTEYAYLLRNFAELCDETTECINLYLRAKDIFENKKMYHEVAAVYLSLSMINAYDGKLSKSKQYIDNAINLDNRELSLCYILNNNSVLEILEKSYSVNTEKNLRNALLLSVSRYETILINSNLLVYYCLIKKFEKANNVAIFIENSSFTDFQYEEFLHIVYQDLYYFYKTFNHNTDRRNYYYSQILNLVNSPNTRELTKLLASGMNGLIETKNYYAQFPFRVDFLGYWEFTIDSDLNC